MILLIKKIEISSNSEQLYYLKLSDEISLTQFRHRLAEKIGRHDYALFHNLTESKLVTLLSDDDLSISMEVGCSYASQLRVDNVFSVFPGNERISVHFSL